MPFRPIPPGNWVLIITSSGVRIHIYSSWTQLWSAVFEFEMLQTMERKISHLPSSCLELCLKPNVNSPSTTRLSFRNTM